MISMLRRLRAVGTAVVFGVGFLMAVLTFNDSLWTTVEQDLESAFSEYDYVVEQPRPLFDDGTLDTELVEQVKAVPGVEEVTPSISTPTIVERGTLRDPVRLRSMDWLPPGSEVVEGEWPGAGEVVLEASVARDLGFSSGDSMRIIDDIEEAEYEEVVVSGMVEGASSAPLSEGGHFVYGEADSLSQVLDRPDSEYSLLFVRGSVDAEGGELAAALDTLQAQDPDREYSVVPTDVFVSAAVRGALPGGDTLATGITAVSAAAFVVLFLVIRSVFTVRIERDRREFSLRRCLGASRGSIFGSVLVEALAIGAVSSLLGVVLGAGLLAALFALPLVPFNFGIGADSVAIAVAAGVVVCAIGALGPAVQAMKSSPLGALRDSAGTEQSAGVGRYPWLRSAVLGLALVGLGASAQWGILPVTILMAAVLVVVVLSLIRPVTVAITRLLLRIPWFDRRVVPSEALGRALANPRRSGSIVALAAVTAAFISLVASGSSLMLTSLEKLFTDTPRPDLEISVDDEQVAAADVLETVQGLDMVADAVTVDTVRADVLSGGTDRDIEGALIVRAAADLEDVAHEPEHLDHVAPGSAFLGEMFGLSEGEPITLDNGGRSLEVQSLVRAEAANRVYLAPEDFDTIASTDGTQQVWVSFSETADIGQASTEVASALSGQAVSYEGNSRQMAEFEEHLALLTALVLFLLGMGVVIALIGISNTLRVSVLERRQEIGLQRALGAYRSTVRGALVTETLVLAVLGCVLGLATGALIAVSGVYSYAQTNPAVPFGVELPVGFFAATILGTVIVGGFASLIAARSAVNVPPVAAISRD